MNQKSLGSKLARHFREGLKSFGASLATKLFGARSFPLFGVPRGLSTHVEREGGVKQILYPFTNLTMPPPKSLEPEIFWSFKPYLPGVQLPEEGILTLEQATATHKGGNLTEKGELITTFLQPIDRKPPEKNDLFQFSLKRFFPKIFYADVPVLTLAAGWQGAFYHWVYEVLPRLHLVEKGGAHFNKIYIESKEPFQKESLELLGIEPHQIINAGDFHAVKAPQLIIPSIAEIPTYWGCRYLRERFLPKITKRPKQRLYVSRKDASRRRIINEEAVFQHLQKYGFQRAELTALPFKEQIELFASAEMIVAPHGAGLSHLTFCEPGTPVLEIFSPGYINPCYWHVADRVGLSYYYLIGEGERYPEFKPTGLDPDIEVDLAKLEASLKLMGL